MCAPSPLGLQYVYVACTQHAAGSQQSILFDFLLPVVPHKARVVSSRLMELAVCVCSWFEDKYIHCLARHPREMGILFPQEIKMYIT